MYFYFLLFQHSQNFPRKIWFIFGSRSGIFPLSRLYFIRKASWKFLLFSCRRFGGTDITSISKSGRFTRIVYCLREFMSKSNVRTRLHVISSLFFDFPALFLYISLKTLQQTCWQLFIHPIVFFKLILIIGKFVEFRTLYRDQLTIPNLYR